MAKPESIRMANDLRDSVCRRLDLKPDQIECPRAKSDDTPCVARDGSLAVADGRPDVCVGCEVSVLSLFNTEKARAGGGT